MRMHELTILGYDRQGSQNIAENIIAYVMLAGMEKRH